MKQVVMTRDMRPFRGNDKATLPDAVADKLIAEGAATPAAAGDDGIRLAPDALPAKPRNRYFTRAGAAAR